MRPVRGQMVALQADGVLQHIVRCPEVYLIPRSGGRVVVGSTMEETGFNKTTSPEAIGKLRAAAASLVPALSESPIAEVWSGLRPATPDGAPVLGETSLPGYFVAGGHYRDGILLAPATARVMGGLICGQALPVDLAGLSPKRFASVAMI